MIRSTYLVARRDYLGYVTAWGFWLGLLFTPVILGIFILAPTFAQNAQPTRYYTVIENGNTFTEAMRQEMSGSDEFAVRMILDPLAVSEQRSSEPLEAFDAARENGASVEDAFAAAGGNPAFLPRKDFVEVPAPVSESSALAPYLLGETLLETPEGPQPLFAAIVVNDDTQEIEYWSENLQARALISAARQAEHELQLDRALAAVNVSREVLDSAREARRDVKQQRVRIGEEADAETEVTRADQAPFIVSIMMA